MVLGLLKFAVLVNNKMGAFNLICASFLAPARGSAQYIKPEREGRQKKIDGPPRTLTKSQTHPPTIRLFFPLEFLF
jgi:hypothetical protein